MTGEAADMKFIIDGLGKRIPQGGIPLPIIIAQVGYDAFHGRGGVVPGKTSLRSVVTLGDRQGFSIRIQQDLPGIEAQSFSRVKRSGHPVAVDLPGAQTGDEDVPVKVGPVFGRVQGDNPGRTRGIGPVKKEQFHSNGIFGIDAEIDTLGVDCGPERETDSIWR
jgi:hypothetical protein